MLYAIGVIVFAVGLLASVALHEVGHMLPAKRFGVKVTQYMVGFGPTLWSRKRGDTEYGFKAIPAGGYVRMIGMVPPRQDGRRSRWPTRVATTVEEFRAASRSEVIDPSDESRQFYRLTPGKKMIVMLGGPCMNLVIYAVITVLLFTVIGQFRSDPTTTVGSVVRCVVPANSTDATKGVCPAGAPVAPAVGKLQPGDMIESIDGTKVASWAATVKVIQASAGKSLSIAILRAGKPQTIS
ncbi:MAG TPA: site-2 protease family protein, partial [Jatrophihabitantaceae bacterium]|nr:site-2 protease family protein [Jatrophihabitantaceae bacterium]